MTKVILSLTLLTASTAANAIQVFLLQHNWTADNFEGTVYTMITDGSQENSTVGASTAVFDWDGTTLSSTGLYTRTWSIGSNPFTGSLTADAITDLSINTGDSSASATEYACVEGTFFHTTGVSGCGGYNFGANFTNESTAVWGPGLAVNRMIGGDDVSLSSPRAISAYDFGTVSLISGANTTDAGAIFSIGNGIAVGSAFGEAMTFQAVPVPAAVWLFGSALGLLAWMRRKTT